MLTPLMLSQFRGSFHRARDPKQSTDYAKEWLQKLEGLQHVTQRA
jgi:hypothetical protein